MNRTDLLSVIRLNIWFYNHFISKAKTWRIYHIPRYINGRHPPSKQQQQKIHQQNLHSKNYPHRKNKQIKKNKKYNHLYLTLKNELKSIQNKIIHLNSLLTLSKINHSLIDNNLVVFDSWHKIKLITRVNNEKLQILLGEGITLKRPLCGLVIELESKLAYCPMYNCQLDKVENTNKLPLDDSIIDKINKLLKETKNTFQQ